eukprot:CAMPEP_0119321764 /NCGR_PEP_ID=MMETSP1333-20130426/56362_1 /TAXON_ID=418940 /ORGANISM="Scyphosphaera apsteinii, Strain RCC1455" /LENGTH=451 /DNA_ID=CAMNT_0007328813 /DNA_START=112 /DNA_END=1467 /DNA_ORIENTATION=-
MPVVNAFFQTFFETFEFESDPEAVWRNWQQIEASITRVWNGESLPHAESLSEAYNTLVHCGGRDGGGKMLLKLMSDLIMLLLKDDINTLKSTRTACFVPALTASRDRCVHACLLASGACQNLQPQLPFRELGGRIFRSEIMSAEPVGCVAAATLKRGSSALAPGALNLAEALPRQKKSCSVALEEQRHNKLAQFIRLTFAPQTMAAALLAQCHNDLDAAVARFFDGGGALVAVNTSEHSEYEQLDPPQSCEVLSLFMLPATLVVNILSQLPALSLATTCATCRLFRRLLPESTSARAALHGIITPSSSTCYRSDVCLDAHGFLAWLSLPGARRTWPLRIIEALELTRAANLWHEDSGCSPDAYWRRLEEAPVELLSEDELLRSLLTARAEAIIRRLVGGDAELARHMSTVGALGARAGHILPPGVLCTVPRILRKPPLYHQHFVEPMRMDL